MSDAPATTSRGVVRDVPGPGASLLTDATGLFGRERECGVIDALLEAARRGRSGSLVVRGEAGLGKTALLGYAAHRAVGMRVLRVTGVEGESDLAFAGFHGLMWPAVDQLDQLPGPQRDALATALGLLAGEVHNRFLISAGVLSLVAAAAESTAAVCRGRRALVGLAVSRRARVRGSPPGR